MSKLFPLRKKADSIYALHKIDLKIERGAICGIIGMSGAGKSTLMRCLTGLEKPSEGKIWIAEEEISSLQGKDLRTARHKIGMIFQHFNLFSSRTALENVEFPLELLKEPKEKRRSRAVELLSLVGLAEKHSAYPAQLSGGEKQRVAIARALAANPTVLLGDEATSALDPRSTQSILQLLNQLNKTLGITIVLITHEMEVVRQICTHVAILDQGKIVEQGEVSTVFSFPQHPITKQFLNQLPHELPEHILASKPNSELLRLKFTGESSKQPIISRMIKNYEVEVNILLGGIDSLKTATIGMLVIELLGSIEERVRARSFLEEQGVHYEVLRS